MWDGGNHPKFLLCARPGEAGPDEGQGSGGTAPALELLNLAHTEV